MTTGILRSSDWFATIRKQRFNNYMSQRLKRWESPRKEGRNDKGKGGSARQRQLKKRTQMLRQKLKDQGNDNNSQGQNQKGENHDSLLFLWVLNSIPIQLIRSRTPKLLWLFPLSYGINCPNCNAYTDKIHQMQKCAWRVTRHAVNLNHFWYNSGYIHAIC